MNGPAGCGRVLTDDVIRATIVGFMLGFVPTNNLASGKSWNGCCVPRSSLWR